jgi:hypothetical protein
VNQRTVVEAGKTIYERHRAELETHARGQFVAVDIASAELFVAPSGEEAVRKARGSGRKGPFHLMRIGSRAAYRFRRIPEGGDTRLIR